MQWRQGVLQILLGIGLFIFVICSDAACTRPLRIGWDTDPPYVYEQSGQLTGFDIELLRAILHQLKCEAVFVELPWSRQLAKLRAGDIDIMFGASMSPERTSFANFSQSYRQENVRLYVHKSSSKRYPLTDLAAILQYPMHIGVVRGNYYGEKFLELMNNSQFSASIETASTDLENFNKLAAGHVEGILVDELSANVILQTDPRLLARVEVHPLMVFADGVYMMFSKQSMSAAMVTDFNAALAAVRKAGVYADIMQHYTRRHTGLNITKSDYYPQKEG